MTFGAAQDVGAFRAQMLDSLGGKVVRLDPEYGWHSSPADVLELVLVLVLLTPKDEWLILSLMPLLHRLPSLLSGFMVFEIHSSSLSEETLIKTMVTLVLCTLVTLVGTIGKRHT